ncbi:lymphatic vessel endothelial hyaluronic receptor 1b isoform X2 [Scophthalmus maximus]|uniref:lymphatic vessel endothelial hyaluronic receptor 1b isoform X2 n=1 Tax=Scophthalmus maximus TaxID=52904 RepID=UPI0015E13134|nr:lymphatic vessel endothelial hyaluronic receptor 1b isoform X2 [Scophthalmus maximus]
MARFWFFAQLLPVCLAASFPVTRPNVIQGPLGRRAAGVFMLIEGGIYTLNFTSARAACLWLNVTMATRDQMEGAVQQGLETCKFGWIAEGIAVIPRISSNRNCGNGKTGVVQWSAIPDRKFGVYCFNASDLEETKTTSKAAAQTSTSPTTPTELIQTQTQTQTQTLTPTPTTPLTASSRQKTTTKSPEQTSAFTVQVETTRSTRVSSTSTPRDTVSTHVPTSRSHFVASKPTVLTSAFPTSVSVPPQSKSAAKPSLGVVPMALIVLGVILLLLTAAGAVWYSKLNIFTCWSPGRQKDDTETEMWKNTDSEVDLRSQHGAGEDDEYDELDRKYSSDITLCVNPNFKTNPSE